jgi:hypothetical protein
VSHAAQVSLCVEVAPAQASSARGHSVQWNVSAWATGGNIPDAVIRLQASPAGGGSPVFTVGCGKDDGTSSCDLGAVNAKSGPRQFQAQLTVPATASAVKSVSLTVIGSTAHLAMAPEASASVSVIAPPPSTAGAPPTAPPPPTAAAQNLTNEPPAPDVVTSPLPVGSLPTIPPGSPPSAPAGSPQSIPAGNPQSVPVGSLPTIPPGSPPSVPAASPTLSPGGNAAGLFPTLHPKPTTSTVPPAQKASTRPVANTSALPEGAPIAGAQLAGLAALALAFVLAVTRLSIRRRPAQSTSAADTPEAKPETEHGNGTPPEAKPETGQGNGTPPEGTEDTPAADK